MLDVAFTITILFSSGLKLRKIVPKNQNKPLIAFEKERHQAMKQMANGQNKMNSFLKKIAQAIEKIANKWFRTMQIY